MSKIEKFSDLVGRTIADIVSSEEELTATLSDGQKCMLYHEQDCCESVSIQSVTGDWSAIIGEPITVATEEETDQDPEGYQPGDYRDSWTWSIYTLETSKGRVVIRWLGESNGYYSESVYFRVLPAAIAAAEGS